jgi:hypothetical protein
VSNKKGEVIGAYVMLGCVIAATGKLALVEANDTKLLRKPADKTKLLFGIPANDLYFLNSFFIRNPCAPFE